MKLVEPVARVLPGWKAADVSDDRVLVRVTARESIEHDGRQVDCFRVETDRATVETLAAEKGLDFVGVASRPAGNTMELEPVKIGLWDRYGGSMPSGWTRMILEDFEFDFEDGNNYLVVRLKEKKSDVEAGDGDAIGEDTHVGGGGSVKRN